MMADEEVLRVLWGKTAGDERQHPLLCHMLDAGSVARILLEAPEARHLALLLARLLGVGVRPAPRIVSYLIALHDLGKASPSFQAKAPAHWARVRDAGLRPSPRPLNGFKHGLESYVTLALLLPDLRLLELPPQRRRTNPAIRSIALALGAHHGVFFTDGVPPAYPEVPVEPDERELWRGPWRQARRVLADVLRAAFVEGVEPIASHPANLSALCATLNGLAILCDWIGSDSAHFAPYAGPLDLYPEESLRRAGEALGGRDILRYLPRPEASPTFATLFPTLTPRPVQAALDPAVLPELPEQGLVIVEAPTGEGKTEAALLLAARLAARETCRGFYFALPTVATSNQMYERVRQYIGRQLGDGERAALLLVNGQAEFCEEFARAIAQARSPQPGSAAEPVVADAWLLPRKRSLLSPYGVGTIDQVMMAALNVRHVGLRLFGLGGKVLIVDEVHAYDLYMSTIVDRLLEWLRHLGTSVVLLSATLPRARRERLIAAYAGQRVGGAPEAAGPTPYPLVTIVGVGVDQPKLQIIAPRAANPGRRVIIERRLDGPDQRSANARFLLGQMRAGGGAELGSRRGSACWLVNTVREARACYLALKQEAAELPEDERPDLLLFHARFLLWRRREVEGAVLQRLGPDGDRARPLILVATQVVEQSLDLDFDLLMSQLAPIDLLLQRLGRLHRHERPRPPGLGVPRLVLLLPQQTAPGRPAFGGTARVYAPFVLLKTLLALYGKESVAVPDDVRGLIEAVYDGRVPAEEESRGAQLDDTLVRDAHAALRARQEREGQEALQYLLGTPDPRGYFNLNPALQFDDEAAERNAWVAAQTRLAEPSVRLVVMERQNPLLAALVAPERRLTPEETRGALRHTVSLANNRLIEHVTGAAGGARVWSLDGHRGLEGHYLVVVEEGSYTWQDGAGQHRLEVSPELGVAVDAKEE